MNDIERVEKLYLKVLELLLFSPYIPKRFKKEFVQIEGHLYECEDKLETLYNDILIWFDHLDQFLNDKTFL